MEAPVILGIVQSPSHYSWGLPSLSIHVLIHSARTRNINQIVMFMVLPRFDDAHNTLWTFRQPVADKLLQTLISTHEATVDVLTESQRQVLQFLHLLLGNRI